MIIDVKPLYKIINNTKNNYFENFDLLCAELSKYYEENDEIENPEEVSAVIWRWIMLFISDGYSQLKENEDEREKDGMDSIDS